MVQVKKDRVRKAILTAARQEFLSRGFRKANMRSIAQAAGCSAGNLYGYFASKRALFFAVADPLWETLLQDMRLIRKEGGGWEKPILPFDLEMASMLQLIDFIYANREDFHLLLNCTDGLGENPYERELISLQIEYSRIRWEFLKKDMGAPVTREISGFFIMRMAEDKINVLKQFLVMGMSLEDMHRYGKELIIYDYYGFVALLTN